MAQEIPIRAGPPSDVSTSTATHKNVQSILDGVTGDSSTGVPGLVFVAVDKKGETITANASGNRGANTKKPMDLDTVFWIASCTKIIATIACLQLVEQDKLSLDDPKHLYKYCPELEKVKVLKEDGTLEDKKKDITLRMLLSHTAGFGYEFFNPTLRDHGRPIGYNVFSGSLKDVLARPLSNQPGSRWEYGTNIDWAGIYLERASGVGLNAHMQKHIFEPLGITDINMFPTSTMKKNLASLHQRWPGSSGNSEEIDHIYSAPLVAETDEEKGRVLNSGGAGCFARPSEYVKILATLLNDGTSPTTKKQILKPETVKEMFTNQIPEFPEYARQGIPAANPAATNPSPELYPQPGNPAQGWGLSWMQTIEPGLTGRGANTCWWAGIANLFYWVDKERGVAGMIASQIMPFGDQHVMGAWAACEKAVYDNLGK